MRKKMIDIAKDLYCWCWMVMIFTLLGNKAFSQKKPLDFVAQDNWPVIADDQTTKISDNGQYICYKLLIGKSIKKLIVQPVDLSWKSELENVREGTFTPDNKCFIFSKADSLGILDLNSGVIVYKPGFGSSARLVKRGNESRIVGYTHRGKSFVYIAYDPDTKKEVKITAGDGQINDDGQALFEIPDTSEHTGSTRTRIEWADLITGQSKEIAKGYRVWATGFNSATNAISFTVRPNNDKQDNGMLFYYRPGMVTAQALVANTTKGMAGTRIVRGSPSFSRAGDKLFFNISALLKDKKNAGATESGKVAIYNNSAVRHSSQDNIKVAVININEPQQVIVLENGASPTSNRIQSPDSDYELFESDVTENRPGGPSHNSLSDMYLVSVASGTKNLIDKRTIRFALGFSPSGKYLAWFDGMTRKWISYNIQTKIKKEISNHIPARLTQAVDDDSFQEWSRPTGLTGWLQNDYGILIYDQFDIWNVDPNGIRLPVNITRGYGQKNNIQFQYCDFANNAMGRNENGNSKSRHAIALTDTMLLSAFDLRTRNTGFFKLANHKGAIPVKLVLDANLYIKSAIPGCFNNSGLVGEHLSLNGPIKAGLAKQYLLVRMNAREYPNLFITNDFKNFKQETHFEPQKNYNWYSTSLVRWKLPDGRNSEGILYKPENFDPHKKYPIIFYYYQRNSGLLHQFLQPELSPGDMSIPWFVSNGYLVFVPDIYYKAGCPNISAADAIISGAKHVLKFPFVDPRHMGLQGHSFGGSETNYIITRTNLFAAAVSASGVSDFISAYGGGLPYGGQEFYEHGQVRMKYSLWQRPDLYVLNSPVFYANKVTTPLLLECGNQDGSVPYTQSIEWFTNLAHCGKKVWLLIYDGEGHVLNENSRSQSKASLDYATRMGQFFDHYLKDAPMPEWMSQ